MPQVAKATKFRYTKRSKKVTDDSLLSKSEIRHLVRKEIPTYMEEKNAITQYSNVLIQPDIPSGVVLNGQGNFFKLLPEIKQSTTGGTGSAYNERIGNEITLRELDIHGFLDAKLFANINTAPQNAKLAVRVMILRCKEINDVEKLFDDMPTDLLIRYGQQSTGNGGPIPFTGLPLDSFRDLNRDTFSVRYDKVHYLNGPTLYSQVGGQVDVSLVPSALKMFRHKLTFGEKGLRLKYSSANDTTPNNFPYFMVIGYSSMSANSVPADNLVGATFNISSKFTDA